MQRLSFLKLALCSALLAAGLAAHAQVTKIRFSHAGPETASQHQAALEFARLVKERSKGQLEVQVYPSSQLGNDSTMLGAVRGGTIDMMMAGSGNFSGLVSKFEVLDIPFLFRDPAHAYATVDGEVGQRLMKELEAHGLKQLAFWEVGFRSITTKNRAGAHARGRQGPEDPHHGATRSISRPGSCWAATRCPCRWASSTRRWNRARWMRRNTRWTSPTRPSSTRCRST